jgi:calcium-dependent protein kinase
MKILELYQDEKHFYVVSEFYNGGELFEKVVSLGSFTEKDAANIIKQVLSAVSYCHNNKIVHRYIKLF